jgi:MinD-like ATPase involved in chromosome partitioning or flagellar assembly
LKTEIILGLNDQTWQLELISNLNDQSNLIIKRRCVDAVDLISSIQTNKSVTILISADFALLNLETIKHISQNNLKVIGVYLADDLDQFEKLKNLGIKFTQGINFKDVESSALQLFNLIVTKKETTTSESTIPGLISIWGNPGAPGRTSVAINTAYCLAKTNRPTLLIDLDAIAPSIASSLSLVSEIPGISSVIHDAMYGKLSKSSFDKNIFEVSKNLHVITGISNAKRWLELRTSGLIEVLKYASQNYAHIVCDLSSVLPDQIDKDKFDQGIFKRFDHVPKILELSNRIVYVMQANPLSLIRCNENLEVLKEFNPLDPYIVLNRINPVYLGKKYENLVNDILLRWTKIENIFIVKEDIELFAKYWLKAQEVVYKENKEITETFNKLTNNLINENFLLTKGVRKLKTAS